MRRAAASWLGQHSSIAFAVAKDDLNGPADPVGLLRQFKLGYYPERSGDVLFVVKPFTVITDEPTGTNHGTPYAYNAQVPVVLAGHGVKPGLYRLEIKVNDLAPTVAALLEMGTPALSEGTVRAEVLNGVR